ncbi:MAG: hypothetical protein ABI824_18335 [Acidobacteriota bacterium]
MGLLSVSGLQALEAGIFHHKVSHLVAKLLPIPNEVSGVFVVHYFGAFLFEYCDHGIGMRLTAAGALGSCRSQGFRDSVEFNVDSQLDSIGPGDLFFIPGHRLRLMTGL